jgi:hypothetical protein
LEEHVWGIEFNNLTKFENHNLVAVKDSVDSMSDNEHSGVLELSFLGSLDSLFCSDIDISCGFVKNNELSLID